MFRKIFLVASFAILSISAYAQETSFGLTAGYLNGEIKATEGSLSESDSASGFYIGALADIALNESFHITPGVNYGNAEESSFLYIPVMAQYYIAESGFFVQAGPQGTISLEDNLGVVNSFGLDLALGAGYAINENFFVEAKYSIELTNRLSDEVRDMFPDTKLKLNSLMVGLGYKF